MEEVLVALRGMARRKAPGLDGLPRSSILSFGPFWVPILSLFSTLLSILAVSLSLSAEVFFPCLLRRVIG